LGIPAIVPAGIDCRGTPYLLVYSLPELILLPPKLVRGIVADLEDKPPPPEPNEREEELLRLPPKLLPPRLPPKLPPPRLPPKLPPLASAMSDPIKNNIIAKLIKLNKYFKILFLLIIFSNNRVIKFIKLKVHKVKN
jgi:hypothetical protein